MGVPPQTGRRGQQTYTQKCTSHNAIEHPRTSVFEQQFTLPPQQEKIALTEMVVLIESCEAPLRQSQRTR